MWQFDIVVFSPLFGEMIQFDYIVFFNWVGSSTNGKPLVCPLDSVNAPKESFFNPDAMIIVERLFGLAG